MSCISSTAATHWVQKFTKDGTFLMQWGSLGSAAGQFNLRGHTLNRRVRCTSPIIKNHRVQKFS